MGLSLWLIIKIKVDVWWMDVRRTAIGLKKEAVYTSLVVLLAELGEHATPAHPFETSLGCPRHLLYT